MLAKKKRQSPTEGARSDVKIDSPRSQYLDDTLLDYTGAAELLGIQPSTLRAWISQESVPVPYYKIGGRIVRFSSSELKEFREGWKKNGK